MVIVLVAGSRLTGQEMLPAFREANVPAARVAALRESLPGELESLCHRLDEEKVALNKVFGAAVGTLQRERVSKRYELARRLVRCIHEDLAKGDVSSLCFAEMEIADLRAFLSYFASEREAWKTFPENPAVSPVVVRLEDFGAKGDGIADDAPAFRAAIAAVRKLNGAPSVLRIPAGTFLLASPDPQTPDDRQTNLVFPALTNCLVTGVSPEKTFLRFGLYDARGLCARGGYNSVFRNFEIRWKETPFFEGEILGYSREEGWIDVSHDKGTLSPADAKWQVRKHALGLHTYRKDGTFIKTTLFFWPRRARDKGDGTYRLEFDTERPGWKTGQAPVIGAKAVLPDRLSGFEAFGLIDARLCTVDSVWVRNGREAFLQPSRCYQCSAVRCRIFPAEGRSFSTNADGFYNSRGSWISDCEFTNMGDDGCNSVMHGGDIVRIDGRTMLCKAFGIPLRAGEICQIVESTTGEYLANLHVVSTGVAEWGGKRWLRIDFTEEIPSGVHTYENTGRGDITAEERRKITLGLLKLARPPDIVFAPAAVGVGYVARNNLFRDNRNTAMVVQCPNALLEGNRAKGMQNGIVVGALLHWNEGPAPYNVVLRDNVLEDNYHGIQVTYDMNNGAKPRTRPVRHLFLENNRISGNVYEPVALSAADDPFVRNTPETKIRPGFRWPDDKGMHINAHGGGILKEGDVYWWYGEDKIAGKAGNNAHTGVRAYSSTDLVNWKDEGLALDVRKYASGDLHGVPRKVERPKVLRSLSTGRYVMYFHLVREGEDYYDSRTGIAVADAPQGPFKFLKSVRPNPGKWPINAKPEDCTPEAVEQWSAYADWIMPDWEEKTLDFIRNGNFVAAHFKKGQLAQDQTLFRDDDGKSYHIYASEFDSTVHIAELTDDLLEHTGRYWRAFEGTWTEAPAVCKRNGWYYLLGSGCSGWAPNAARAFRSRSLAGPWEPLGNPCRGINPQNGLGPEKTWGCQSTFLLPDPRRDGEFIAMFDMWRPENAIDGRYVWLPIEFEKDGKMFIRWRDAWNPNDKEGN